MVTDTLPEYPRLPNTWAFMSDAEKIDWLWSIFYVLMIRCDVENVKPTNSRRLGHR